MDTNKFGYVVLPHPYTPTFRNIGKYHSVSFIPKSHLEQKPRVTICLWLTNEAVDVELLIFLISPGHGLMSLGSGLTSKESSRVVNLPDDTGLWTPDSPTAIANDLLHFNDGPCLLFISWNSEPEYILKEAVGLSLKTQILQGVESLRQYLESSGIAGDAVLSSHLSNWHKMKFEEIRASIDNFLFDPSVLVIGIMQDLVRSLAETKQLDIARHLFVVMSEASLLCSKTITSEKIFTMSPSFSNDALPSGDKLVDPMLMTIKQFEDRQRKRADKDQLARFWKIQRRNLVNNHEREEMMEDMNEHDDRRKETEETTRCHEQADRCRHEAEMRFHQEQQRVEAEARRYQKGKMWHQEQQLPQEQDTRRREEEEKRKEEEAHRREEEEKRSKEEEARRREEEERRSKEEEARRREEEEKRSKEEEARRRGEKRSKAEEARKQQEARRERRHRSRMASHQGRQAETIKELKRASQIAKYDLQWEKLKHCPLMASLKFADIPWPVFDSQPQQLSDLTPLRFTRFFRHPRSTIGLGKVLRVELLRWHPDKFLTLIQPQVVAEEWENVDKGMQMVSRELTNLMGEVY